MGGRHERTRLFFRVVLPVLVIVNVGLGLVQLVLSSPRSGLEWVVLGGGAFSLVLGGWLAGAWWSRIYWRNVMARQVRSWRSVVDAVFGWIEELPVPPDALSRLKNRIEGTIRD